MPGQGAGDGGAAAQAATTAAAAPAATATPPTPSRRLDQWLAFALAQEARSAPHPAPEALDSGGPPAAWRLTLSHLDSLPLFAASERACELSLGASLFDEAAGCFLGPTACSAPVPYDMRRSKGRRGFHVDLSWDLFLHTRAVLGGPASPSPARCSLGPAGGSSHPAAEPARLLAVVELVLLERSEEGVTLSEVSAGWCAVPLSPAAGSAVGTHAPHTAAAFASPPASPPKLPAVGVLATQQRQRPGRLAACLGTCAGAPATRSPEACPPPSPLRAGCLAARMGAGGALSVPLFVGSPRYLLVRREAPAGCPPPAQLLSDAGAECRLFYSLEPCPEADAWAPLAPLDCLLSRRDVVPGVQRLAAGAGRAPAGPTLSMLGAESQLAPPRLAPMHAVVLSGLRLHLPEGFCEAVRQHATTQWLASHGAAAGAVPSRSAAPAQPGSPSRGGLLALGELQRRLQVRVSVHNGRRFVGPPALCSAAALEPVPGRRGQHELVAAGEAHLAWLPADRCVALVLELLLLGGCAATTPACQQAVSDGSSGSGGGGEAVLCWAAVDPFSWRHLGGGSLQAAVAEGPAQADLRSGPGRWLRAAPVLDWRRLIERANRSSPEPPRASFHLSEAPGQAVWPPPAVPLPLQAQAAPVRPAPSCSRQLTPCAISSEAETLVSVRAASQPRKAAARGLAPLPSSKPLPAVQSVQAWQIHACYDAPPAGAAAEPPLLPQPLRVRTRPQQAPGPPTGEEAAALHAGSPTAKRSRSRWAACTPAAAAAEAAAAALPAAAVAERQASLAAELSDPLTTTEASLQLLAFEAEPGWDAAQASGGGGTGGGRGSAGAPPPLPARLHFTWRCLGGDPPTVTAPLVLQPAGGSAASGGRQLFALAQEAASGGDACLPQPERLQLLDAAALERGLAELAAQGAPPAAAASLACQHRLWVARYLAQGRLQLDAWDSDSLLPLGSLWVPLRGLLRQGQPAAELLLRVPVEDASQAVQRQAGHSGSGSSAASSSHSVPLRGSFLLRLACTGRRLPLPAGAEDGTGGGGSGAECTWPSSPLRRHEGSNRGQAATVVRARPALEDASGPLLRELARQEGVPEGVAPERLPQEVVGRAAAKVLRLLALQGALGGSSTGAAAGAGGGAGAGADEAAVGQLVERRLLGRVEAAREQCKRDAILQRLQAELPACVALCVGPGDVAAFECSFTNSSGEAASFAVDTSGGGELCLVGSAEEWQKLAPMARLAGLAAPASSGQRAVASQHFTLGPHERCLLRIRLRRSLAGEPAGGGGSDDSAAPLAWHEVSVRQLGSQGAPAALFRVAVQRLAAPAVDRTVRLYWPAGASEGASSSSGGMPAAVFALDLERLPGCSALLEACERSCSAGSGALAFACGVPGVSATAQLEQRRLLLSCALPPPAGSTSRFLLAAYSSSGGALLELWEVFLHSLPAVCMSAPVGGSAAATCTLPPPGGTAAGAELACHWRGAGAGAGELQAGVHPGSSSSSSSGGQLELRFSPAAAGRRELLLALAERDHSVGQHGRQAALLMLELEGAAAAGAAAAPRAGRSFEVAVPAGQAVSKKVRYANPLPHTRRFRVRPLGGPPTGGLLRVGAGAAAGFQLVPGQAAPVKLTFNAAGWHAGGQHEVLAAVESAPVGDGGGGWRVEEVFSVCVTVA